MDTLISADVTEEMWIQFAMDTLISADLNEEMWIQFVSSRLIQQMGAKTRPFYMYITSINIPNY